MFPVLEFARNDASSHERAADDNEIRVSGMRTDFRMRRVLCTIWLGALLAGCGSDSGNDPSPGSIVGVWNLVTVNGVAAPPGLLTWTFTESTVISVSGDVECTETASYTLENGRVRAAVTHLEGAGCGSEIGAVIEFPVTVTATTLTATISDPEAGVATFVFSRA
jgi:hypothetical protein